MKARTETKTLIARQIAVANGLVWERILESPKMLATYLTLAENILACVERKLRAEDNCILDHIESSWR